MWNASMIRRGLVLVLVFTGLSAGSAIVALRSAPQRPVRLRPQQPANATNAGLIFRLSDADGAEIRSPRAPVASAVPLDDRTTQALFDRLPPLPAPSSGQQPFGLREKSLPPPRTGRTIVDAFPPSTGRGQPPTVAPDADPVLTILRHSPDGDVPLAANVSVTFSQPMVAVTSQEDLARQSAPARLTPQPGGSWRWVGTQTLLFEPATRLPMATEYQVEVPAGTASVAGKALRNGERWRFSTPAPKLVASYPSGVTDFTPIFFAAFDQRIDPSAVLSTIRVQAGSMTARLRLATDQEVKGDEGVRQLAADAQKGRWLAFRSDTRLPADAAVRVTLGPGTPSAEGPKKTAAAQGWDFHTYGKMRMTGHSCGWSDRCQPSLPWSLRFSNPIDEETFDERMVRVQPPLPGANVSAHGDTIVVQGPSRGLTTYRVTITGVRDAFGQALEQPATATFKVDAGEPWLTSAVEGWIPMSVLDPAARLHFPVYSLNYSSLSVQAYSVGPEDWAAYQKAWLQGQRSSALPKLPGRLVISKTVAVKGSAGQAIETDIDLAQTLPRGVGQIILLITPVSRGPGRADRVEVRPGRPDRVLAWLQSTRIGLDAFADGEELVAWASTLDEGRPLANVKVSLLASTRGVAVTGADGLARLPLGGDSSLLVARSGDDVAILPEQGSEWRSRGPDDRLAWQVFDDRGLYRPGEEVKVKGYVRIRGGGRKGDMQPVGTAVQKVAYALAARGNEVARGVVGVNGFGAFDFGIKLPPNMSLGEAELRLEPQSPAFKTATWTHSIHVEEFRRPEFEVTSSVSDGPQFVRGTATVTATASYYAGGPLPGAQVDWEVTSMPTTFTPPNRSDFSFGRWVPWWIGAREYQGYRRQEHTGRTNAEGRHSLRIDFDEVDPPEPSSVSVSATVIDVNRQAWATKSHLLVHPSSLYVGLKTSRYFVERGQPLIVDGIVTDLDGRAVSGRSVTVRAQRLEWKQRRGQWREEAVDAQTCSVTSAADPSRCTFPTSLGGRYQITARVTDKDDRPNETQITRWVSGGTIQQARNLEQEDVTLIPDRDEYHAGDTAELLVIPPFTPAEALMTVRRSGIVRTERFTIRDASYTVRIPIEERWTPNVFVQVDLVGASQRANAAGAPDGRLPKRPAFASGTLDLRVPPLQRTLALAVTPREKMLQPGGETTIDVALRNAAGNPVARAEVAVIVADEAVLALTGYKTPDPVGVFYENREGGVTDNRLRRSVLLARLPEPGSAVPAPPAPVVIDTMVASKTMRSVAGGIVGGVAGGLADVIRMRTDFNPLALFAASVVTDASGRAEVRVKLPDNLTRYRVMVVAATEGVEFGSGESTITARLPLMVRASAPRFLNLGDTAEIPIVLQNQTDAPMSVDVALRASNAAVASPAGRRVAVPANDRVEVRFPAVTIAPGEARFQVAATAGQWSDASEVALPVRTPATTEAFAAYGQIDAGATAQRVVAPSDAFAEFGGLELSTSSTALQSLTDAVIYLVTYPFECSEQISSRVLAVAALKDVLSAFSAPGLPDAEKVNARVENDLQLVAGLQNDDGGFPLWRRGDTSWPYVSIHVAHALVRAKARGFKVPQGALDGALRYVKDIEKRIPRRYGDDERRALIAYALYVRTLAGDSDAASARKLIRDATLPKLSFEAVGWLLSVLAQDKNSAAEVAAIRTHLNNRATDTAAAAHFAVSYRDGAELLFESDRRADAVILDALIAADPKSDLIPKVVEGLLAHRTAGRWENTQENVFVLLALDRYFNTYEKVTPDFVARAWLGDRYAGEHAFKGRTTDRHLVEVPMKTLMAVKGPTDLILSKEGAGRLYYRLGLQYAPRTLELAAFDSGFTVERAYTAIDDPGDIRRDADGTWHVRAGARVRVRVSMVAPTRRYHVALVDPLPAGFESLNPALGPMPRVPPEPTDDEQDRRPFDWFRALYWFDHENLRDDRAEVFSSLVWDGVYTYTYVARATTPGQFVVPPPKAEEMYHPETFGRGATDRVIIEK